jgi:hypothetical protein
MTFKEMVIQFMGALLQIRSKAGGSFNKISVPIFGYQARLSKG